MFSGLADRLRGAWSSLRERALALDRRRARRLLLRSLLLALLVGLAIVRLLDGPPRLGHPPPGARGRRHRLPRRVREALVPPRREPPGGPPRADRPSPQRGGRRRRGPPLPPPPGHRSHRLRRAPSAQPARGRAPRGRQHDLPAARADALPLEPPHRRPQGEGGDPRAAPRAAALEGPDPRALPQPGPHGLGRSTASRPCRGPSSTSPPRG